MYIIMLKNLLKSLYYRLFMHRPSRGYAIWIYIWISSNDMLILMQGCSFVFTLTSTVGARSLSFGEEVAN